MTTRIAGTVHDELQAQFGLDGPNIEFGLTQDELFYAAIAHDRGRVEIDGPSDAQKAFSTALGVDGPLVYFSDPTCTGRPVQDTFAVAWPEVIDEVWWKKDFQQFDPDAFEALLPRVIDHLNAQVSTLYCTDVFCGSDPAFAKPYRFVGEFATHAYFANIMFPKDVRDDADRATEGWTMINVPSFTCDPARDGTLSGRAVIMDLRNRIGLVLGRADYCGVVKKTMFTVMNFAMPKQGALSMHCSSNVGPNGDSAILFGLSGTGKTTLSADPDRELIGDDEHVWSGAGIANFEDGCYAKLIDLNKTNEPVIAAALSMKNTLIENVPPLHGRAIEDTDPQDFDLTDGSRTENTRFAYPLSCNPHVAAGARGPHPQTIVLLTADAFGVLPPVSLLTEDEVMYHFVMGFTSKLAGTEVGVTEPQATFSSCFGAPFMSHKPMVYANLLRQRMSEHKTRCILLNTGWSGGPYGKGERMSLTYTRALLNAALAGSFDDVATQVESTLGLTMPVTCDGVPDDILNPRQTWDDPSEYDAAAARLRDLFRAHYAKQNYGELGIPRRALDHRPSMDLFDLASAELSVAQLHDILRLRGDVFVIEQACVYPDINGRDLEPGTRHVWLEDDGGIAAYLRLLRNGAAESASTQIGRVATRPDARGQGLAGRLVDHALATGPGPFTLESQSHLVDYYAGFGFEVVGPEYLEDGIPHRPMAQRAGAPR